nr:hypothetical protein CFP56_24072 [Quercus suber]
MHLTTIAALALGFDLVIATGTKTSTTSITKCPTTISTSTRHLSSSSTKSSSKSKIIQPTSSATSPSACTLSSLPTAFKIKDNSTSANNFYYVDAPGTNEIYTTTEAAASVFYVASLCDGPQQCGIETLSYNTTKNGVTTSYAAYNSGGSGPITVSANSQGSGNIQPESLGACSLRLLPYLDHDFIYTFNCNGALSLNSFEQLSGCQSVELQYTAA